MLFLEALAILIGTTIGAGILGIPYAVSKVGFVPGLLMLIILGVVTTILELMYMEVTLRTKEDHEIPGYGGLYLGFPAKMASLLMGIIGGYGALLAYIIGQGTILHTLIGGPSTVWSILFLAVAGYIVYRGLYAVRVIELIMVAVMFCVVFILGVAAEPHINLQNLSHVDVNNIIIPYGVLMFALSGMNAIPQLRQHMKGREEDIPRVIVISNLLVVAVYAVFMWITLGVTGADTTQIATVGLGNKIGPSMVLIGNLLAFITMSTSFMTNGLSIRRLFQYDYGMPRFKAWLATIMIPLVLFIVGARDFIQVVGLVGGIIISLQSIIIVSAFWKARTEGHRRPELALGKLGVIGGILILMYTFGSALTLMELF